MKRSGPEIPRAARKKPAKALVASLGGSSPAPNSFMEMAAFDRLPRVLRQRLAAAKVYVSSHAVRRVYGLRGLRGALQSIDRFEAKNTKPPQSR